MDIHLFRARDRFSGKAPTGRWRGGGGRDVEKEVEEMHKNVLTIASNHLRMFDKKYG